MHCVIKQTKVKLLTAECVGKRTLVVRGGAEGNSCALEVWMGSRVLKELAVPKKLHGAVYNDGWFGIGAAWSPDESRIAYVAEVISPMSWLLSVSSWWGFT